MPKKVDTPDGHTYLTSRPNFPNHYGDNAKDMILDRLANQFIIMHQVQKTGMAAAGGQIGVVMVSVIGLLGRMGEVAFMPRNRMQPPMNALADVIEPGDFDPEKEVLVCLFYDDRFGQPFHPNSDVGLFVLERA